MTALLVDKNEKWQYLYKRGERHLPKVFRILNPGGCRFEKTNSFSCFNTVLMHFFSVNNICMAGGTFTAGGDCCGAACI
jgi:hypothetical protein